MRNRPLSLLLTAFLLLGLLPGAAAPAYAAELAGTSFPRVELALPDRATAGETVTIRVTVDAEAEGGVCCGELTLRGPDGQLLTLVLHRSGPDELRAEWATDPHLAPGRWQAGLLRVEANSWTEERFTASSGLNEAITIAASGEQADRTPPELVAIRMPEKAAVGEAYRITVQAKDDLSGVDRVEVALRPGGEPLPQWVEHLRLEPGEEPDTYTATVVMDPPLDGDGTHMVMSLTLADRAGNEVTWGAAELDGPEIATRTFAVPLEVPAALITSPYVEHLIHPGRLTYTAWLETDRSYLAEQLQEVLRDPVAVQERLLAELPQLREALDDLRREVYTDPESGLEAMPYATTGKWMVLERALLLRTYVLAAAGLPEGALSEEVMPFIADELNEMYELLDAEEGWITMEGETAERYGQVAAAYLHAIAQSPEAVAALKVRHFRGEEQLGFSDWDPALIYFVPVRRADHFIFAPGEALLRVAAEADGGMMTGLHHLMFQTGLHFGETFLSPEEDERRDERWGAYIALRGLEGWRSSDAVMETPAFALAVDFVRAFTPHGMGRQFQTTLSVPHLETDAATAHAFRDWAHGLLAHPPGGPALSREGMVQVGTAGQFRVEVRGENPEAKLELVNEAWLSEPVNESFSARRTPERLIFQAPHGGLGKTYFYRLTTRGDGDRQDVQYYMYTQVPVLLKPVPAVTTDAVVTVRGTTLPNRVVRIGRAIARSSASGLFHLRVPLEEGANDLHLTVQGLELGARFTVYRTKPGEEAPLREVKRPPVITLDEQPVIVTTEVVTISGQVERAHSLTFNGEPVALEPDGRFSVTVRLEPDEVMDVELTATGEYGSTTETWLMIRVDL